MSSFPCHKVDPNFAIMQPQKPQTQSSMPLSLLLSVGAVQTLQLYSSRSMCTLQIMVSCLPDVCRKLIAGWIVLYFEYHTHMLGTTTELAMLFQVLGLWLHLKEMLFLGLGLNCRLTSKKYYHPYLVCILFGMPSLHLFKVLLLI